MSNDIATKRAPILDPAERAAEVIFGAIMAVSFTGSLSVATAGRQEVRTMAMAALGSSLAWGLTDGVMYLIDTATSRNRIVELVRRVRKTPDAAEADAIIATAVPERLTGMAGRRVHEAMRVHLLTLPEPRGGLGVDDYRGAIGVALLVVSATLPIVVPFTLTGDVSLAMRASNGVALVTLFVCGVLIGRHALGSPWRSGATMVAVGAVLIAVIMALGG